MTLLNIVLKFGDIPLGHFCRKLFARIFFLKRKFDLEVTILFKGQKKFYQKNSPGNLYKCAKYGLDNLRGLGVIRVISGADAADAADAARFTPNTYK